EKSTHFDRIKGLPNADNIDLNIFLDTIRAFNGKSHFKFDPASDQFIPDAFFNSFEGTFLVRSLHKNEWLKIYQDNIERMDGNKRLSTFYSSMNRDYHNILPMPPSAFLLCLDDGYLILPQKKESAAKQTDIKVYIREWKQSCDEKNTLSIPGGESSFTIEFFDKEFLNSKSYRFRILPVQKDWKNTHTLSTIIINHLNPGQYTLEIMRNDGAGTSKKINVEYPWYSSLPARLIYILLG